MRARWNYLLFRNILQLLPLQMAIAQKKLLVGEISVLVFGRCHFMNPSLHSICVICRKPWHSLCRLIFYASKYNLVSGMVSLHHIWRISFFNAWPAALGKMPFHAESITVKNGRELISPTKNWIRGNVSLFMSSFLVWYQCHFDEGKEKIFEGEDIDRGIHHLAGLFWQF